MEPDLPDLMVELKYIKELLAQDPGLINPKVLGNFEGECRAARDRLIFLERDVRRLLVQNIELLILKGENEDEAIKNLVEMGALVVNSSGLYEGIAKSSDELNGQTTGLSSDSYGRLIREIRALHLSVGLRFTAPLEYIEGDGSKSTAENLANVARSQLGATADSLWILNSASSQIMQKLIDKFPVAVVTYNVGSLKKEDFSKTFSKVHELTIKDGSKKELKQLIKEAVLGKKQKVSDEVVSDETEQQTGEK